MVQTCFKVSKFRVSDEGMSSQKQKDKSMCDLAGLWRWPATPPCKDHHTSCFMERSTDCKIWNATASRHPDYDSTNIRVSSA